MEFKQKFGGGGGGHNMGDNDDTCRNVNIMNLGSFQHEEGNKSQEFSHSIF